MLRKNPFAHGDFYGFFHAHPSQLGIICLVVIDPMRTSSEQVDASPFSDLVLGIEHFWEKINVYKQNYHNDLEVQHVKLSTSPTCWIDQSTNLFRGYAGTENKASRG